MGVRLPRSGPHIVVMSHIGSIMVVEAATREQRGKDRLLSLPAPVEAMKCSVHSVLEGSGHRKIGVGGLYIITTVHPSESEGVIGK